MIRYTKADIAEAIGALGLHTGDVTCVHSALLAFGRPADFATQDGAGVFFECLSAELGPGGTIAVPAFTFSFCRGQSFDRGQSPSEAMGVFSEFVRRLPTAVRSSHPIQSVAAHGTQARAITAVDTLSAFDTDGAFDRMLQLDGKLILLGASVDAASIVHLSEQRSEVPYRYWKEFSGEYVDGDIRERRTYKMFVRDLAIDPTLTFTKVSDLLAERGQLVRAPLGAGSLQCTSLRAFTDAAGHVLANDPWAFVSNRMLTDVNVPSDKS